MKRCIILDGSKKIDTKLIGIENNIERNVAMSMDDWKQDIVLKKLDKYNITR